MRLLVLVSSRVMCREQSNAHAAIPVTGSDRITELPSSDFLRPYVRMYLLSLCQQGCQLTRPQLCRLIIEEFPSYPVPTQALARRALRRRVQATWTVLSSQSFPVMDTRQGSIVAADHAAMAVCSPDNPAHQLQMVKSLPNADNSAQWPVGMHAKLLSRLSFAAVTCQSVPSFWIAAQMPAPETMSTTGRQRSSILFARACSRCSLHV